MNTYLITENFNLPVASINWDRSFSDVVKGIDLQMKRQSFDTFLIAEIRAETLDRDVNLMTRDAT